MQKLDQQSGEMGSTQQEQRLEADFQQEYVEDSALERYLVYLSPYLFWGISGFLLGGLWLLNL